jgi:hypothetical protein
MIEDAMVETVTIEIMRAAASLDASLMLLILAETPQTADSAKLVRDSTTGS